MSSIIRKTHADLSQQGREFILSDATPDRYDDVIDPDGWDLKNFNKNPIALFNHNSDAPIGVWNRLSVKDGALRGHLRLAPKESSPRISELHALIDAGVLRSCSVGFRPIESSPRKDSKSGGVFYGRSELVECSLVSVPANPNAVMTAKSLNISDATLRAVFTKIYTSEQREEIHRRAKAILENTNPYHWPTGEYWQGKRVR